MPAEPPPPSYSVTTVIIVVVYVWTIQCTECTERSDHGGRVSKRIPVPTLMMGDCRRNLPIMGSYLVSVAHARHRDAAISHDFCSHAARAERADDSISRRLSKTNGTLFRTWHGLIVKKAYVNDIALLKHRKHYPIQ